MDSLFSEFKTKFKGFDGGWKVKQPDVPGSAGCGVNPMDVRWSSLAFINMLTRTRAPLLALLSIIFRCPRRPRAEKLEPVQRDVRKQLPYGSRKGRRDDSKRVEGCLNRAGQIWRDAVAV